MDRLQKWENKKQSRQALRYIIIISSGSDITKVNKLQRAIAIAPRSTNTHRFFFSATMFAHSLNN